jgi:TRAP transporter 4TM/12TM fusion protein
MMQDMNQTAPAGGATTRWAVVALSAAGIAVAMLQTLPLVPPETRPLTTAYYYLLLGIFLAVVFLEFPKRSASRGRVRDGIDWALAAGALASGIYLAINARSIITLGWAYAAPPLPTVAGAVIFLLSIEAVRRTGGRILAMVCIAFGLYPLIADSMPGVLWGNQFTWPELIAAHALGTESIIGIPFRVVADLLIGYIIFGVALATLGGGEFFMALALKILGKSRGGPAKVAIVASGLFGSLSGSVVSNIITTGTFTIPAMKKSGYSAHYASAVEACASTGGTLMPPIMGAAAFLMASFLAVPYGDVVAAAVIPSLLFYAALLLQTDGYAARNRLEGAADEDIPTLASVIRQGWVFVAALVVLVYVLLVLRLETYAPWYATALLLVGGLVDPMYRARVLAVPTLLREAGGALAQLIGILAGVGLVVGALSITGVGSAFARELVQYADGNVYLLLFYGAVTSFVLGMGMTVSACYVFLAIILAPALVQAGLNPMASHLYILYWGMLSYITPPVAIAAITAASVGKADALKTSLSAMRLGLILFILPVFFVLQPALIGQGSWAEVALAASTAAVSVALLSAALSGWLYFVGRIGVVARIALGGAALLSLYPGAMTDLAGLATAAVVIVAGRLSRPAAARI